MNKVMTIFVKRRPSSTPSWIFQNAQGWPKSTRRILKIDHLGYTQPLRKKLTLTFPGSTPWLPDYTQQALTQLVDVIYAFPVDPLLHLQPRSYNPRS